MKTRHNQRPPHDTEQNESQSSPCASLLPSELQELIREAQQKHDLGTVYLILPGGKMGDRIARGASSALPTEDDNGRTPLANSLARFNCPPADRMDVDEGGKSSDL